MSFLVNKQQQSAFPFPEERRSRSPKAKKTDMVLKKKPRKQEEEEMTGATVSHWSTQSGERVINPHSPATVLPFLFLLLFADGPKKESFLFGPAHANLASNWPTESNNKGPDAEWEDKENLQGLDGQIENKKKKNWAGPDVRNHFLSFPSQLWWLLFLINSFQIFSFDLIGYVPQGISPVRRLRQKSRLHFMNDNVASTMSDVLTSRRRTGQQPTSF